VEEKRNPKKIEPIDLQELLVGITSDPRGWDELIEVEDFKNDN